MCLSMCNSFSAQYVLLAAKTTSSMDSTARYSENVVANCSFKFVRSVLTRIHRGRGCAALEIPLVCGSPNELSFAGFPESLELLISTRLRRSSMDVKPFLSLTLVSSAFNRALCLVTASLKGCVAGAAIPLFARRRSCTIRRARPGESYIIQPCVSVSILKSSRPESTRTFLSNCRS